MVTVCIIIGRNDFSDQFRKIIIRYKRIGYNMNVMRQTACLMVKPVMVNNFAALFNCMPAGRASDSGLKTSNEVGWGLMICLWSCPPGFNCWLSVSPAFQC